MHITSVFWKYLEVMTSKVAMSMLSNALLVSKYHSSLKEGAVAYRNEWLSGARKAQGERGTFIVLLGKEMLKD